MPEPTGRPQYVVTAHSARFTTAAADAGGGQPGNQLYFRGQLVPPTATQAEIEQHLTQGAIQPVVTSYHDIPGYTTDGGCDRLAQLAAEIPADQAIVELGVYLGRSLAALATGAQQGHGAHVWGVDPWDLGRATRRRYHLPENRDTTTQHLTDLGLTEQVTLLRDWGRSAATLWDGPPVGLLHVDANPKQIGGDIHAWAHLLAPEAWVAIGAVRDQHPLAVADLDQLTTDGTLTLVELVDEQLAVTRYAGGAV